MTKIRKILKWADRGKHWTSKQTRSASSIRSLVFVQPTLCFFCQANMRHRTKVGPFFPYANCNNHSFVVLFVDWSVMKLMLQSGKVQLQELMRSTECSSQGVWVAEVPPTKRVDEFPLPPYVFGSMKRWQNHFDVITISIIWRKIIERRRKSRRKQWL